MRGRSRNKHSRNKALARRIRRREEAELGAEYKPDYGVYKVMFFDYNGSVTQLFFEAVSAGDAKDKLREMAGKGIEIIRSTKVEEKASNAA